MIPEAECILIGGSSKGPVHLGALKEYTKHFSISRLAGSSAGSLWGGMFVTGMSLEQMEQLTIDTDFSKLVHISWIDYIKSYFRMHLASSTKIVKFLESIYRGKTFKQCDIPFYVFVTNASKKRLEILGPENYPDMKISEAVRISIAIPGIFDIVKMNGDFYWDGGMGPVIPLSMFDKVRRNNSSVLGMPAGSKLQKLVSMIADDEGSVGRETNIFQRLGSAIGVFIDSNFEVMMREASPDMIIAQSRGLGLKMTDFAVSKDTKIALIAEGSYATEKAIAKKMMI